MDPAHLTSAAIRGKMPATLGIRLVVGQQTLDLYAVVRIHDPQPEESGASICAAFCLNAHGIIMSQFHRVYSTNRRVYLNEAT